MTFAFKPGLNIYPLSGIEYTRNDASIAQTCFGRSKFVSNVLVIEQEGHLAELIVGSVTPSLKCITEWYRPICADEERVVILIKNFDIEMRSEIDLIRLLTDDCSERVASAGLLNENINLITITHLQFSRSILIRDSKTINEKAPSASQGSCLVAVGIHQFPQRRVFFYLEEQLWHVLTCDLEFNVFLFRSTTLFCFRDSSSLVDEDINLITINHVEIPRCALVQVSGTVHVEATSVFRGFCCFAVSFYQLLEWGIFLDLEV